MRYVLEYVLKNALVLASVMLLLSVSTANAVSDDFVINTLVGSDTTAPTVPTGLTAEPIATSQINLAWLPSTDDFLMGGYQVFRDAIQIATATVTSYVDVGLTPSTTYTYYVTAFDSFGNVSASSTLVATTTFSITLPPVPATTTPSQPKTGTLLFQMTMLTVVPTVDGVIISYETSAHIRGIIRWGQTMSYELGSLAERAFSQKHETQIVGLLPGTSYHFVIEGEHGMGVMGELARRSFTTLPIDDAFPPPNVSNLRAVQEGSDIVLSWQNPTATDFEYVRILRSNDFYPSDTADGWLVYEGKASLARERGVAVPGSHHYYTVFSYDSRGNVSSGAVVTLSIPVAAVDSGEGASSSPPLIDIVDQTKNILDLKFTDLRFMQDNKVWAGSFSGWTTIDAAKQVTISIPYERLPEHLKTILVTLTHPTDSERTFSFLLRANKERTSYTATLAPFGTHGEFGLQVKVFDFTTAQVGYITGTVQAQLTHTYEPALPTVSFIERLINWVQYNYLLWFLLVLLLLLLMARRLIRRSRTTKQEIFAR